MKTLRRISLGVSAVTGLTFGCAPAPVHHVSHDPSTVTSDDLQDPHESIESVIQKKVSGVNVRRTSDGGISLQIRGASSYRGQPAPPLFILNGLPFRPGPDGALTGVDPNDIDTIRVLKGAEAGIYGIDGANGVILITTKQAGKR
ncbi:MAG: TonB-dependent receptor plug domain-containing protein [Gemmatimonadaceae bacterium]